MLYVMVNENQVYPEGLYMLQNVLITGAGKAVGLGFNLVLRSS